MIKAIETNYSGITFRSKLEARHAKLLDAFEIKWEYEPHLLTFNGGQYLPDFYLPEIKTYLEVKGDTIPGKGKAEYAMAQCWKDGSVDTKHRLVVSNGRQPTILTSYSVREQYDRGCYPAETLEELLERERKEPGALDTGDDIIVVLEDNSALVECGCCSKIYFIEGLYSWTCSHCGRDGDDFKQVQFGYKMSDLLEGEPGYIDLPQIRQDWR